MQYEAGEYPVSAVTCKAFRVAAGVKAAGSEAPKNSAFSVIEFWVTFGSHGTISRKTRSNEKFVFFFIFVKYYAFLNELIRYITRLSALITRRS